MSMKKVFLLVFLFGWAGNAQSNDKLLHFGAGVVSGAAGAFIAHEISGGNKWWAIAGAVGGSLIAGMAKEAIDKNNYGKWDNGDLAATVAGGVTVGVAIEIFHGRKKRKSAQLLDRVAEQLAEGSDWFQEPSQNLNSR